MSRIDLSSGGPYLERLRLSGSPSAGPALVRAFRLAGPAFDAPRVGALGGAVSLGGPVKHKTNDERLGGLSLRNPLKSIAVSQRSGQTIYHDFSLAIGQAPTKPAPPPAAALAAARSWLTRLGWPASRMPLSNAPILPGPPRVRQVVLGWPGVGPADTPAAVVWVAAGNRIAEALVLPPITTTTQLRAIPTSAAWQRLKRGRYPLGVSNMIVAHPPNGTGTLSTTSVTHVFDAAPSGLYLIPAYRFSGTAHFRTLSGSRDWFALVPATSP